MLRNMILPLLAALLVVLDGGILAAPGGGESEFVRATRTRLLQELPTNIAKLRAELKEKCLSELTVKDVGYTRDPRAVEPLIEVLAADSADINVFLRRRGGGVAQHVFAAQYLGEIGDRRAVPALAAFLERRLEAGDAFPDTVHLLPHVTGRTLNRIRRDAVLAASLALFKLGELHTALRGLRYITSKVYDPVSRMSCPEALPSDVPTHLASAVLLPAAVYDEDQVAMDTIEAYVRDCAHNPNELVRAAAAKQLLGVDESLALATAAAILESGLDDQLLPSSHSTYPKKLALEVLVKIGGPESETVLRKAASSPSAWLRSRAALALDEVRRQR